MQEERISSNNKVYPNSKGLYDLRIYKSYYLKSSAMVTVLQGELKCHGFTLTVDQSYRFEVKNTNPFFLMVNTSDENYEGASSQLFTTLLKIDFKKPYKSTPDTGLFLENSVDDSESEEEIEMDYENYIEYDSGVENRIRKMINFLHMDDTRTKLIIVIGSKKVGKTTLCHYLTNSLLERLTGRNQKNLFYLEGDPGQPSMCPPGFLSLNQIKKPLFCNRTGWIMDILDENFPVKSGENNIENSEKVSDWGGAEPTIDDITGYKMLGDFSPEVYSQRYIQILLDFVEKLAKFSIHNDKESICVLNYLGYLEGVGSFIFSNLLLKILKIKNLLPFILMLSPSDDKNRNFISKMQRNNPELKTHRLREVSQKDEVWGSGYVNWMRLSQDLPQKIKLRSRQVKKNRDLFFMSFFSIKGARITFSIDRLVYKVLDKEGLTTLYTTGDQLLEFTKRKRKRSYFDDNMMETELIGKKRSTPEEGKKVVKNPKKLSDHKKEIMKLALATVSGICSLRINCVDHIVLVEDYDLEKEEISLIVPNYAKIYLENLLKKEEILEEIEDLNPIQDEVWGSMPFPTAQKPNKNTKYELIKSPFMILNPNLLQSNQSYDSELDNYGALGKKPFWTGPSHVGIGAKPHRKIVSVRRNLLKK